uniref:DNA polymerase III subunit delta' n=1 Tax=Candidatus Kentrum eta TaxID=2126337 RepID=A0A450UK39_9GAMM|nr:MAG: DNA polymerase-3 subunit delta' [Candidatus Kentron sp. H]VFJ92922.1 MAG: DNA polymerase-3 subunit delta' [Candidatus Kentron sp. H]VFJ99534.1 MAG: DNA polymerase-3 subunit delta' [Candidatus Kentron sp. H]
MPEALMPWHHRLWEQCLRMRQTDRFHHAFLLRGPEGCGKRAFARRWANVLVCQEETPAARPCGRCRGCTLFGAGTHPDVRTIARPPDKKSIGIDRIRGLIDYVWLSRHMADRKVVLLPGAEEMTLPAANTLLKTLEEPPGSVVFLLISPASHRLPVTIRSRCQRLDFPVPLARDVLPWLTEQLPPGADAAALLTAAGGAPLEAMRYWEENTLQERTKVDGELTALLTGSMDPLAVAERWKALGCAAVVPWSSRYLADLIRLRFTASPRAHSNERADLARRLDPAQGYRLFDRCLAMQRLWAEAPNLNEALMLEGLAMDFAAAAGVGETRD